MERQHSELVERVSYFFKQEGFEVDNEIELPDGKGAADIRARKGDQIIHGEVKTSPACVRMKKVKKQLGLYSTYLGGDCILFSPRSNGFVFAENLDGSFKGPLEEFVASYHE